MFVHEAGRLARKVSVDTACTVEPSSGEAETKVGVAGAGAGDTAAAGGTIGVWFATAATKLVVVLPAASCRAFKAGTAYDTTTLSAPSAAGEIVKP